MKTKLSLLLANIAIFLFGFVSSAQNDSFRKSEPQILSPSAFEFCKYGKVPVNYFNGLPNITVPLTEVYAKGDIQQWIYNQPHVWAIYNSIQK